MPFLVFLRMKYWMKTYQIFIIKSGFEFYYTHLWPSFYAVKNLNSHSLKRNLRIICGYIRSDSKMNFPIDWNRPIWHWKWNQYPDIWRAGNQLDSELRCFRAHRNRIRYTVVLAIHNYEIYPCDFEIMWPWIKVVWF